ncbi:hypothetical protein ACLKA6_009670 [Drosophila palustris]
MKEIVETLFPGSSNFQTLDPTPTSHMFPEAPAVTVEETLKAASVIRVSKAPGPDAIPNKALRLALMLRPDSFAAVFERCIYQGTFPSAWKVQNLVLIPKPELCFCAQFAHIMAKLKANYF